MDTRNTLLSLLWILLLRDVGVCGGEEGTWTNRLRALEGLCGFYHEWRQFPVHGFISGCRRDASLDTLLWQIYAFVSLKSEDTPTPLGASLVFLSV